MVRYFLISLFLFSGTLYGAEKVSKTYIYYASSGTVTTEKKEFRGKYSIISTEKKSFDAKAKSSLIAEVVVVDDGVNVRAHTIRHGEVPADAFDYLKVEKSSDGVKLK